MTKPKCAYPNTQSASYAVERYIREELDLQRKLTTRPYNRFEPINAEWWMIPSTEWPAYAFGKLFFHARNDDRDLYCGFYIEKGLDQAIAAAFPTGKKVVMNKSWTWHRVLKDMGAGALDAPLLEVVRRSGHPWLLALDGGFIDDPAAYDRDAPPMDWNYLPFECDGTGLQSRTSSLNGSQFTHLPTCKSLSELAHAISQVPQLAWTWINLYLGLELEAAPLEPDPAGSAGAWEAEELWYRCLAPWLSWVV
jgi:hypothetical protein